MAHDVFISYSSKDKSIADSICATLEGRRIRCWIAPRDILPGTLYSEALIDALGVSRLLVLVFSSHSNVSPQVAREVERAVSKGVPIVPFRVEDVPMSKAMEYFISSPHWLDALTPPLEQHLAYLADTVSLLLERMDSAPPGAEVASPDEEMKKVGPPDEVMQAEASPDGVQLESLVARSAVRRSEELPVGAIRINDDCIIQQYCAEYADIRFSISNLTDRPQKVPELLLRIVERRESDVVRLKKAGAMLQEFRLSARIDERDVLNLFAGIDAQEILEPKQSDAFRLRLEGAEGMHYTCLLTATFEDLGTGDRTDVVSSPFEVEYPIRNLETLRRRKNQ